MKDSLAIAYAMKKKKKKMADGGPVLDADKTSDFTKSFKGVKNYASGGQIKDNYQPEHSKTHPDLKDHEMDSGYMSHEGDDRKHNSMAMSEDGKDLNQRMVNMKAETSMAEQDLVNRIMKKKSMDYSNEARYSEGGKVANDTDGDSLAGFKPNQFDDLVLDDDLSSDYGDDDNAGDDLGNEQEDEDRKDIVARIMRSRGKKDRMPNPA